MARHPWELTLHEFLEKVERHYGIEIEPGLALQAASWILKRDNRRFVVVMDEEAVLQPSVLRALCRFFHLPPVDFGLDADDED